MKEQNNRIVRKEKYNIAGLKVLMTTYYEETYKRAKKYIAKDENWDEKEADIVIDLGNETYEKIYDEYMPYLNCEAIEYIYRKLFSSSIVKIQWVYASFIRCGCGWICIFVFGK